MKRLLKRNSALEIDDIEVKRRRFLIKKDNNVLEDNISDGKYVHDNDELVTNGQNDGVDITNSMNSLNEISGNDRNKTSAVFERNDSGYSSHEDEDDVILTHNVLTSPIHPPLSMANSVWAKQYDSSHTRDINFKILQYDSFSKSEPKPDQKSGILIPHPYQTDTAAGDYFGATLCTYTRPSGKKYKYQHLLRDFKDGYPAQKMRICEGDELVLIGQTFTPDLNHTEVLNIFHHDVKVDGKTRFCLVLRKSEKKKSSWYWYETSAILSPDPKQHLHNEVPIVKDLKIGPAQTTRFTQKNVFSIYDSSLYMFIDQSGIHGVPIERVDKPIYVKKTVEISFNQKMARKAALFGMDGTSYVSLDVRTDGQRDIRISNEEMCTWFEYEVTGDDNKFHVNDCFLAFDKIEKKFVMSKIKDGRNSVIFQDVGRVKGIDHPDCACASELANMDAEEITPYFHNFTESGYASKVGSQEKDTWMPDDYDPTSPIILSTDNLDMD